VPSGSTCSIAPELKLQQADAVLIAQDFGMLAEAQLTEIDALLGEFCRREPPVHVRGQLRYTVRIDGNAVTLVESRPALRAEIGWRGSPVARFRFNRTAGTWYLFWLDRNLPLAHV
jgi:hypothetical protein